MSLLKFKKNAPPPPAKLGRYLATKTAVCSTCKNRLEEMISVCIAGDEENEMASFCTGYGKNQITGKPAGFFSRLFSDPTRVFIAGDAKGRQTTLDYTLCRDLKFGKGCPKYTQG